MGLSTWLAHRAVAGAHVLLVEGSDAFVLRVAAERQIAIRGWRLASTPADSDVLLQVGPFVDEMREVADRLWDAFPGPRARVSAVTPDTLAPALDDARRMLLDGAFQVQDAAARPTPDVVRCAEAATGHGDLGHGDMDGMGMAMSPDGIPLAGGSEHDRDRLEMDALPMRLGPVLPHWPAGLVLDVTLHGDVIVDACARVVTEPSEPRRGHDRVESPHRARCVAAARTVDAAASALSIAGVADAAARARAARDVLLDERPDEARVILDDLRRSLGRSRILGWSLRRTGVIDADRARDLGLPRGSEGDCRERLLRLLDRARLLAGASEPDHRAGASDGGVSAEALARIVTGLDLGAARLVIATLAAPTASAELADA